MILIVQGFKNSIQFFLTSNDEPNPSVDFPIADPSYVCSMYENLLLQKNSQTTCLSGLQNFCNDYQLNSYALTCRNYDNLINQSKCTIN